jgi:hypothetical protein
LIAAHRLEVEDTMELVREVIILLVLVPDTKISHDKEHLKYYDCNLVMKSQANTYQSSLNRTSMDVLSKD